jgi:GT2 family glycosyltransferase
MDVSIVLINYRSASLLIQCIESIHKHTQGVVWEAIVVDNDPAQGEGERVREQFPEVRWVDMPYNAGFGRANNVGMQQAKGRYVLILNADTLLKDNVLLRCVNELDARSEVVALGAYQCTAEGLRMPFYASFNTLRKSLFILPPGRLTERLLDRLLPEPTYADPEQFDWLVGAFMLVRREQALASGGFDEDFFMYAEDVEWAHRLSRYGKLNMPSDAEFIHLENENPYRRTQVSWINRFGVQMQVSNLLWIRKSYGVSAYLILMIHYLSMVPIVYLWKVLINLRQRKPLLGDLLIQKIFRQKVGVLFRYFWDILWLRPKLYKITSLENIDQHYTS